MTQVPITPPDSETSGPHDVAESGFALDVRELSDAGASWSRSRRLGRRRVRPPRLTDVMAALGRVAVLAVVLAVATALLTPRLAPSSSPLDEEPWIDLSTRVGFGMALVTAALCLTLYIFGARRVFHRTLRTQDVAFLGALLLLVLGSIAVVDASARTIVHLVPSVPPAALFYAVPVAMGAMTVRLTMAADVALSFAALVALLGGALVEPGISWSVVAFTSSLTGAFGVSRSHRTTTTLLAGLFAGAFGAVALLGLELQRGAVLDTTHVFIFGGALAAGALSGVLVVTVMPVVEVLFGYLTEARLHRLSDLNHPLLKDLIVHAPGTWHHSVRTAQLAEAAAHAVGASALLARAMALYHDIGKTTQPRHFKENQKGGDPHAALTPQESAQIVRAHVARGVALAQEHGLPRAVIAAIEEHHADNVMESFWARARERAAITRPPTGALEAAEVQMSDFRYDGRPPQSTESALVMIADQIEAASHDIESPERDELCALVDAFVNRALADDTLAECDLSLRDLGRARVAFKRELLRLCRQGQP